MSSTGVGSIALLRLVRSGEVNLFTRDGASAGIREDIRKGRRVIVGMFFRIHRDGPDHRSKSFLFRAASGPYRLVSRLRLMGIAQCGLALASHYTFEGVDHQRSPDQTKADQAHRSQSFSVEEDGQQKLDCR